MGAVNVPDALLAVLAVVAIFLLLVTFHAWGLVVALAVGCLALVYGMVRS